MNLIFLPGLMCDARLFKPQLQAFPNAKVITQTKFDTIEAMAADVLQHAPKRFAVAGLSMGGIVAMEVVRQAAERVTHVALLCTNHHAEINTVKELRKPQIAAVMNGRLETVMRNELIPRYFTDSARRADILDTCVQMGQQLGEEAFINQTRALMSRPDQSRTLAKISCPTLILCGDQDALCPVSLHMEMARIVRDATLCILKNTGHLATLETSNETNLALANWLEIR